MNVGPNLLMRHGRKLSKRSTCGPKSSARPSWPTAPFSTNGGKSAFKLTPVGLTSGQMESEQGLFAIDFDFVEHQLVFRASSGLTRKIPLYQRSVADFYEEYLRTIALFGVAPIKRPTPTQAPEPIPFADDTIHDAYDRDAVNRWFQVVASTDIVLQHYRAPFRGKSSPVSLTLAGFLFNIARFLAGAAYSDPPQGRAAILPARRKPGKTFPAVSGREMSPHRD